MPVARSVQWAIVLLAGLSWPFVYAISGQVGPLLFFTFAAGWRWMGPGPSGRAISAALGTAIKLQPVLLLAWAVLTGRRLAAVLGL